MVDTRVSDLSAGGAVAGTDLLYVVETAGVGGVKKTMTQVQEFVEDELNGAFISGSNITITYSDVAGTFTFDFTGTDVQDTDDVPEGATNLYFTNERVDDRVDALIQDGTGLTWTYDDGANTLTGNVSLAGFSTTNLSEGSNLYFTDERAQDAVGAMVDSTLVYVDATPLLTRAALTGDVTAAQGSNATTIANDAVTYAKFQNASAGFVVLGKTATGSGDYAEIAAGTDTVLGRNGSGNLVFAQAATGQIADAAVTLAKMANLAESTIIGRAAGAGTGVPTALTATQVKTLLSLGAVEVLTANRTYYVRTDGSDSNTGLVDNSGGAFLTIQKAINVTAGLIIGAFNVTIQCNDASGGSARTAGCTVNAPWLGTGTVTLQGNTGSPTSCEITVTAGNIFTVRNSGRLTVNGFELSTVTSGFNGFMETGGHLTTGSAMLYGANAQAAFRATKQGVLTFGGGTISGSMPIFFDIPRAGVVEVSGGITVTISGTPAWSNAFITVLEGGRYFGFAVTYSGAATGTRFTVTTTSTIQTFGGGASHFPGNVAGTTDAATFGVYQ